MYLRGITWFVLSLLVVTSLAGQQPAETGPVIKYPLTEKEGPWLIHIGSFRGDEALEFANRFAEETRSKYKYQTYVYSMNEEDARQDREALRQMQLKTIGSETLAESTERQKLKTVRVIKEFSVFVGSFPDMENARIEAARIKEFDPPSSIPAFGVHLYNEPKAKAVRDPEANTFGGIFGLRATTQSEEGKRIKQSLGNPYRQAFVVRNPVVTRKKSPTVTVQNKNSVPMDPAWNELNAREKHSIFSCPKSWTLVVAKFDPPSEVSPLNSSVVQVGNRSTPASLGKGLENAAETARQMAELLRDGGKGYDAYVFHTRQYSLVTVGAFEHRFDPNMEQAWNILSQFAQQQKDEKSPFSLLLKVPQPMQIPGR
ncbi:MAG: hypothetical protein JNJ77_03830 [Planctomycetia bacterium]|nr:hypothetical protein [Planctomycetia bacterium]